MRESTIMLSNEYLLAKIGVDTAENEPCQVCPLSAYGSPRYAKRAFVHHYVGEGMEEGLLFLPTFEYDWLLVIKCNQVVWYVFLRWSVLVADVIMISWMRWLFFGSCLYESSRKHVLVSDCIFEVESSKIKTVFNDVIQIKLHNGWTIEKKVNSPRRAKISQPWRRTTRRSASRLPRERAKRRGTVTSSKKFVIASHLRIPSANLRPILAHVFCLQVFEPRAVAGVALSIFRCRDDWLRDLGVCTVPPDRWWHRFFCSLLLLTYQITRLISEGASAWIADLRYR